MSISIYFIQGDTKSACRNNAYSVVNDTDNSLLEIVPEYTLGSKTPADLKAAFEAALETVGTGNKEKLLEVAHYNLENQGAPKSPQP